MTGITLLGAPGPRDVDELAAVLVDCVDSGASVNFLRPLAFSDAHEWWAAALTDPHARTWVAREQGVIVGCVRLLLARQRNGQHRAEVSKLLVVRRARGRGLAAELLAHLETWAAANGRHRLILDTETHGDARRVYERLGWTRVGEVPEFALTADGELTSTTYFTKGLAQG